MFYFNLKLWKCMYIYNIAAMDWIFMYSCTRLPQCGMRYLSPSPPKDHCYHSKQS